MNRRNEMQKSEPEDEKKRVKVLESRDTKEKVKLFIYLYICDSHILLPDR